MKFSTSSSELLASVKKIYRVINKSSLLDIIGGFLFAIKDGLLSITATDLETFCTVDIDVYADSDGSIVVPSKELMILLQKLPAQPITFEINEANISITSAYGKYHFEGWLPNDFPNKPSTEEHLSFPIDRNILKAGFKRTLFCVSKDKLRPAMNGIYFNFSGHSLTMVSTDAHILSESVFENIDSAKCNFIVRTKAAYIIESLVKKKGDNVFVSLGVSNICFSVDSVSVITRLVDVRFLDYKSVIPYLGLFIRVNRKDLMNGIERVCIFSWKTKHQVVFKIGNNRLDITAKNDPSSAIESLSVEGDVKMTIGFDAMKILPVLKAFTSDEIDIYLDTPTKVVVFRSPDIKDDFLLLCMPLKLYDL